MNLTVKHGNLVLLPSPHYSEDCVMRNNVIAVVHFDSSLSCHEHWFLVI